MKLKLIIFCIVMLSVCFFTSTLAYHSARDQRTFLSLLNRINRFSNCGLRSCPPWKCQDDSAVIHGYCCQCPGFEYGKITAYGSFIVRDNVPVPCYPDLKCPVSSEPLCSDYNFMMNCCCTGS